MLMGGEDCRFGIEHNSGCVDAVEVDLVIVFKGVKLGWICGGCFTS